MSPRRRRAISALLFFCATLLLVLTTVTPFAFYSQSSGGVIQSAHFYPGTQFRLVCTGSGCYSGWSSTDSYGQSMADLYTVVWWLLSGAVFLSSLAVLLALLGALGRRTSLLAAVVTIVGIGLALLGPLTAVFVEPRAYASDLNVPRFRAYYLPCDPGSNSPCHSFIGSAQGGSLSWGAGLGWYVAVLAAALLVVGFLLNRPTKSDPRLLPAALAIVTVLSAATLFSAVYSSNWQAMSWISRINSFVFFTIGLIAIPSGVCIDLSLWARRRLRRARLLGWEPS